MAHLQELPYPGDSKLEDFVEDWFKIADDQEDPLSDRQLERILFEKIKGSAVLKPYIDKYNMFDDDDPDHIQDRSTTSATHHAQLHSRQPNFDTDSSEDERRVRKGSVKPLELQDIPVAKNMKQWMMELYRRIGIASKRSGPRTLRWIQAVQLASSSEELAPPDSRWEELDQALAHAIMKVARGGVKRELLQQEKVSITHGHPLCGRSALWTVLHRLQVEHGALVAADLRSLLDLTLTEDSPKGLELFLDRYDAMMLESTVDITEQWCMSILEPNLRKCTLLQWDFVHFDHAVQGTPQ